MGWNFFAVDENGECLGSLIVQDCEKLVFCCQKAFEHCEMRLSFDKELDLIGLCYKPSSGANHAAITRKLLAGAPGEGIGLPERLLSLLTLLCA